MYNLLIIERKTCTHFLGLSIDQHLNLHEHVHKSLLRTVLTLGTVNQPNFITKWLQPEY